MAKVSKKQLEARRKFKNHIEKAKSIFEKGGVSWKGAVKKAFKK